MPSVTPLKTASEPVKQSPQVSKERKAELLAKVRVLREKMQHRGGELTGLSPDKAYRWVNIKEGRQAWFQGWGYSKVTDPKVESPYKKPDGTHINVDRILYEIPKEMQEAIDADNVLRGLEGIEEHRNAAINTFHRYGVKEWTPDV